MDKSFVEKNQVHPDGINMNNLQKVHTLQKTGLAE